MNYTKPSNHIYPLERLFLNIPSQRCSTENIQISALLHELNVSSAINFNTDGGAFCFVDVRMYGAQVNCNSYHR